MAEPLETSPLETPPEEGAETPPAEEGQEDILGFFENLLQRGRQSQEAAAAGGEEFDDAAFTRAALSTFAQLQDAQTLFPDVTNAQRQETVTAAQRFQVGKATYADLVDAIRKADRAQTEATTVKSKSNIKDAEVEEPNNAGKKGAKKEQARSFRDANKNARSALDAL